MNHFTIRLWHGTKSGFYTTTSDDQLSGRTEKEPRGTSQSQCAPKKSWSLVVCCPSDPLQLSESQWNHYIWEVCSANWWDVPKIAMPATGIGQQKGPSSSPWQCLTKSGMIWATKCFLIHHIHLTFCQPTTTSSSILTTFCRENFSTASKRQIMLSKCSLNPKAWIVMLQEKNKFISLWQNVLIVIVPVLINKDVVEPSYNDLKFTSETVITLFSSVQSLSCVQLFVTPWTAARQASLSNTNSQSLLKLMFIMLVMSEMTRLAVWKTQYSPVQFSSVAQSCLTLCNPMDCSTPGLPVHHQLLEPTQIHVHCIRNAIQPSYPLSSPSPPTFNLSQHQGLFQWVGSSPQVAKVLEFQLQHQSFQWICRTDFLLGWTGWTSLLSKELSRVFSNTTVQKHQFFHTQLSL